MKIKYAIFFVLIVITNACVKSYTPNATTAPNHYLVVDGFINASPNSITTFKLSYSRNLADTFSAYFEPNAQVTIQSKAGAVFNLLDSNSTGLYTSSFLTLNQSDQYQLKIKTKNGDQFLSNFVPVKITPPIDSINWQQTNTGLNFFVNNHDANNATHYYKWDFIETWEHHSPLENTDLGLDEATGLIYFLDSNILKPISFYKCWTTALSTKINVATSIALSQDVISHQPINTIVKDDIKLNVRYSILLNQYGITPEAYNYWILVEKNSQTLGTLFDPQPSQLLGNITSTLNVNEPVIGYISACTQSQKRIFVNNADLQGWSKTFGYNDCQLSTIASQPTNWPITLNNYDTSFAPYYFAGSSTYLPATNQYIYYIKMAKKYCIDCRWYGGTNNKPSFW